VTRERRLIFDDQ